MGRRILGPSDLSIGEKRRSGKWASKTEGTKFAPMKKSKGLRLRLTEN